MYHRRIGMENYLIFLSWSVVGPFLAFILCISLFLYLSTTIRKDARLMDYFTNLVIVIGAIAWVVITS
jgi:hypothetical protein